ncbi:hypothetical protein LEMLEM_LOCUS11810 [Lemmus lemmus]
MLRRRRHVENQEGQGQEWSSSKRPWLRPLGSETTFLILLFICCGGRDGKWGLTHARSGL